MLQPLPNEKVTCGYDEMYTERKEGRNSAALQSQSSTDDSAGIVSCTVSAPLEKRSLKTKFPEKKKAMIHHLFILFILFPLTASPVVVVVLCSSHSALARSQRLGKSSRQAGIRRTVRRGPSTSSGRVLRVHAHRAVASRRCEGLPSCGRSLRGRRRWSRLRLRCSRRRCSTISHCLRRRRRWGWRRFRCWGNLLLQIGLWCPSLSMSLHVHTQPPSCSLSVTISRLFLP